MKIITEVRNMNTMKTIILMTGLTLLLVIAGNALGGRNGMMTAFIFASMLNMATYWFSDKIVLAMYGAREVSHAQATELHSIVRELSLRAGVPMPKVYLIDSDTSNAFATGRNPDHAAIAVTRGIMNLLTQNELSGVLGHELSHIKNRDILIGTIAATVAGAISMLANMAHWTMMFGGRRDDREGGNPLLAFAMMIFAPIAAMLIQMAISRSREYLADENGAKIAGNPLSLAKALGKLHRGVQSIPMEVNPATAHMFIVNPLSGGGFITLFSTHPPIEERIRRLEKMVRS